ncbi:type II toxin-antitoxin system RatA family toxin [Rhodopila sp.]|uniref:type II toxin-antitoxin system RatA family toxin n=1 Tax=Rhodopila sp. TaxID=2480087 RepID=UPI003D0B917C
MPSHTDHKLLPYTPDQLFDMVADVKDYPRFIPWCQGAHIHQSGPKLIVADLEIGFGPFRESFTSHVDLNRPHQVMVKAVDGPLEYLSNQWVFTPAEHATRVDFAVDFQFKSHLLDHVANTMFHQASMRMMGAFEARAHSLYKSHRAV